MAVGTRRRPGLSLPLRGQLRRRSLAARRRRASGPATALSVRSAEPLRVLERHADGDRELAATGRLDVSRAEERAGRRVGVLRVGAVAVRGTEDASLRVLPARELAFDRPRAVGRERQAIVL